MPAVHDMLAVSLWLRIPEDIYIAFITFYSDCRLNSKSQVVTSLVDGQISGFTISPAINWKTAEKGLSVAKKVKGGKLKASYGFDSTAYGIEYDHKPYKVSMHSVPFVSIYSSLYICSSAYC